MTRKNATVRVLSSRVKYRGPLFSVHTDYILEPGGVRARRDVVRHHGSVVIMALDEAHRQPRVLLARQYRYVVGRYIWELPAGHIDPGERPLAAAKRELLEETGYSARSWKRALRFWPSPGFLDELMTVYLVRDLCPGKAQPEADEVIRLRFFPLATAVRMAMTGTIRDSKTVASVLWLQATLR